MSPSHLLLVGGLAFSSTSHRLLRVARYEFGSAPPCLHSCCLIAVVIFCWCTFSLVLKFLLTVRHSVDNITFHLVTVICLCRSWLFLCSSVGPDQAHILTLVHQISSGSWPGSVQDSPNLGAISHTTTTCFFRFWLGINFWASRPNYFWRYCLWFEVRWLCWTKFTSHLPSNSSQLFRWCSQLSHSWGENLPFAC